MMLVWLADVLRAAGVRVVEVEGWRTRGLSMNPPLVVIAHHTATRPTVSDGAVVRLLRDGRTDLAGPLAHVGLARDGTAHVIAAGRANHAGAGGWQGVTGNVNAFGIEAFNDGVGERWPQVQLDAYDRVVAAVLNHEGRDASWLCGHREWAPQRKIDPTGIDLDQMRSRVQELLNMWTKPGDPINTVQDADAVFAYQGSIASGIDASYEPGSLAEANDRLWVTIARLTDLAMLHDLRRTADLAAQAAAIRAAVQAHEAKPVPSHPHGVTGTTT